jgi:hypothetical protein
MSLATEEQRARLGRWLLAATTLLSALGLGALHTPVLCACAVLAAAGTALLWYDAEPLDPRTAATTLVAVAVGLILWTGIQTIPLPRGLLASLASENADVWSRCLSPLREDGPSLAPISLDPIASRVQILRGIVYLVVFLGALRVARRPEGVAFLERTLIISSVAVAGAALVHPVLGARKVFGLYEPQEVAGYMENHVGPLLNLNHLAAYGNIGLILAFGAVIERRDAIPRLIALVVLPLLGATTVWTMSRGGTAAMVIGVLLTAVLSFASRRSKRLRLAGPLALVVVAVGSALLVFLSVFDATRSKFAHNDLYKLALGKNTFALVREFPFFGTGRGAFESTFPHVRQGSGYWVFTHPENILAQWTTEWGVPIAAVAFIAIALALRPRTPLARSRPPAGAWAALVAVALHNLVDFNSEVPGVMIALASCAAIITGGTGGRSTPARFSAWASRPTLIAMVSGAVTLIGVAMTLPFASTELYTEERAFRDFALERAVTREGFHDHAREVMLRHPAEAYFPFVGAVRATATRDESVIPWAARALERSPVYGRVHLLLARTLFVVNPSQARLEYRTACTQDPQTCAVDESLRLVRNYRDAMELVADEPQGLMTLRFMGSKLTERLPSTVVELDRELTRREPRALGPVQRAAARSLGDIRHGEAWCDGDLARSCVAEGLEGARRLRENAPELCAGHALVAELLVASGEGEHAIADLDQALEKIKDPSDCARRLVSLAVQTRNNALIDSSLDRLSSIASETTPECVRNLTFASGIETSRRSPRRALMFMKKAWEQDTENDTLLAQVASMASAQGLHGEALEAYSKLSARHPSDTRWTEAVNRERKETTRNIFERRSP